MRHRCKCQCFTYPVSVKKRLFFENRERRHSTVKKAPNHHIDRAGRNSRKSPSHGVMSVHPHASSLFTGTRYTVSPVRFFARTALRVEAGGRTLFWHLAAAALADRCLLNKRLLCSRYVRKLASHEFLHSSIFGEASSRNEQTRIRVANDTVDDHSHQQYGPGPCNDRGFTKSAQKSSPQPKTS